MIFEGTVPSKKSVMITTRLLTKTFSIHFYVLTMWEADYSLVKINNVVFSF